MSSISIIAYIILTLSIGYAFAYSSFGDVNVLLDQKQKYLDSLDMVNNIENKKNELLTEFNRISLDDKKNIETVLPNSSDFVKLISQIDAVAAKYGISIDKISSKEVNSSTGTSIENAEPSKTYRSEIIGFSFVASYAKFNTFLRDLEKSLRILDVRSVKLSAQKDGMYSYDVEFETYWWPN
ncbi:MAG: type 4a pilus biogenesis protein PilO [Candidatus Zambryskibacteria bacterium]